MPEILYATCLLDFVGSPIDVLSTDPPHTHNDMSDDAGVQLDSSATGSTMRDCMGLQIGSANSRTMPDGTAVQIDSAADSTMPSGEFGFPPSQESVAHVANAFQNCFGPDDGGESSGECTEFVRSLRDVMTEL